MKTFFARFLPDSIVGRTVLALVVGLLVSHLVALSLYSGNRLEALLAFGGRAAADRLAAVAEAARDAATREELRAARLLGGPELRFAWSAQPLVAVESDSRLARIVRERLKRALGDNVRVAVTGGTGTERPFAPDFRPEGRPGPAERAPGEGFGSGPMGGRMMRPMGDPTSGGGWLGLQLHEAMHGAPARVAVWASVGYADGRWLNLTLPLEAGESLWAPRFGFSFLVLATLALGLSVWAVRRATGPLKTFAAAARDLGADANAPPLAEGGPREVREAARAFNGMRERIRRFVEDRTRMVAAISHDLRTPITRLRLRAELMEEGEPRAKMLADLGEMERMVSATLAFARDDATPAARAPFDLAELLRGLVADGRARAGESPRAYQDAPLPGRGLKSEYAGPSARMITGDALALKRAFANLLDNAWRYGGAARVTLSEADGQVAIAVDDDGPGIPEGEQDNVFRPFYRLEGSRSRETGGAGLGLALARSTILAHGGTIDLANRPDGGLRVRVSLPLG
jgi:signal transduction histidine kinase